MTPENERRRWPRRRVEAKAEFRRKREMRYSIPVHDLTAQGCRIGSPERLIRGETVWLQLPSLESLPATVRWLVSACLASNSTSRCIWRCTK